MNSFPKIGGLAAGVLLTILFAACSKPPSPSSAPVAKSYRCPMHPWITSARPGNCTICGMALVPVPEGEAVDADVRNLITLQDASLRVLGVATVPARRMELTRTLRFSGIFEDDDTSHRIVAAFYDGRIDAVHVEHVGVYVKRGEPLAAIYSPELLYVVREYQSALRGGNQDVARVSARRLVQYGLSPEQVAAFATRSETSSTIDLLAPTDGTVLVRKAYSGQYIKTGEPLFEIGDLSHLWFHAEVYERDVPSVQIGQKAILASPTVPGREFEGKVTFIDPNFDPVTRSTKVRIEVNNPVVGEGDHGRRYLIPHRAYAEAHIAATLGEALVLPRSAVLRDGSRSVVYVEKSPGSYEQRAVVTGRVGDEGIEILSGLDEKEPVVAQGNLMIDAEAQLRGDVKTPGTPAIPFTEPSAAAIALLKRLSNVSEHLAADDVVAAANAAKSLRDLAVALAPSGNAPIDEAMQTVRAIPAPPQGEDLRTLRKSFLPWSEAGAALAVAMKIHGADPGVRIFECPMTANSFPGAPSRSRWVQGGDGTRNPFYGVEMLNCGAEVQP